MQAYRKAATMMELASSLDVTVPTTYNYCKRLEIDAIKKSTNLSLSLDIFKLFQGSITLEDLSAQFSLSRQMIRYHLNRSVYFYWVTEPTFDKLPRPTKLAHIKIAHLLVQKPKLESNPMKIAELTGNTFFVVEQYLSMLFMLQTQSAESITKKKKKKKKKKVVRDET